METIKMMVFIVGCFLGGILLGSVGDLVAGRDIPAWKGFHSRMESALDAWRYPRDNLHEIVAYHAWRHNIDPALVAAVIRFESAADPCAVSRAGAQGLMQLMPNTARRRLGQKDAFTPYWNVSGGVSLLSENVRRYGLITGLAVYNYGSRAIGRTVAMLPSETRQYVSRILRLYARLHGHGNAWKQVIPKWIPRVNAHLCQGRV